VAHFLSLMGPDNLSLLLLSLNDTRQSIMLMIPLSLCEARQRNGDTSETRICPQMCGFSRTWSAEADPTA
jgi:hypothetical protein